MPKLLCYYGGTFYEVIGFTEVAGEVEPVAGMWLTGITEELKDECELELIKRNLTIRTLPEHPIFDQLVAIGSIQCYLCQSYFIPDYEKLSKWASGTEPFEPTDWSCGCEDRAIEEVHNEY